MTPNNNKYYVYFVSTFVMMYIAQVTVLNRLIGTDAIYLTGGTFIYFTTPIISDVVAEVYGPKYVKSMINIGCVLMLSYSILVTIPLHIHGPSNWQETNQAYSVAIGTIFRSAISGVVAIYIGQRINAFLMIRWQKKLSSRYFLFRSLLSSLLGDGITVMIATISIFFNRIGSVKSIFISDIIPELLIMTTISAFCSIPAAYIVRWLCKTEGINRRTRGVKFNPFVD